MHFSKRTLATLLLSLALGEVSAQQADSRFDNSTRNAGGLEEGAGQQPQPPPATGGAGADGLLPLPGNDNGAAAPSGDALQPLPTNPLPPTRPAQLASFTDLTTASVGASSAVNPTAVPTTLLRVTRGATTAAPSLSTPQPLAPIVPPANSAAQSLAPIGGIAAPSLSAIISQPAPDVAAGIVIASSAPGGTAVGTGEVPLASATTDSSGLLPIPSATEAASASTDASVTGATGLLTIPSATGAADLAPLPVAPASPVASGATGLLPIPAATDAPFPLANATGTASLQPINAGAILRPTGSAGATPETPLQPLPATGPFTNSTRPINGTAPGLGGNSTRPLVPGAGSGGPADGSGLQPLPGGESSSGPGSPADPAGGDSTSGTNPSGGADPLAPPPNATGGQGGGSPTGTLRDLPGVTSGPTPTGTLQDLPAGSSTLATSFTSAVPSSLTTVVTSNGQTMTLTVPNAAAITAGGSIVSGLPQAPGDGGDPNAASAFGGSDALAGVVAAVVAMFLMI